MDWASSEFVKVLSFLLPGFVAAWVFHGLTPYPKPSQFERLVHALILTAIVSAAVFVIKVGTPGVPWDEQAVLAVSVGMAFLLGGAFALAANRDILHGLLRRLGVTSQNSFPSEWYSAFARHSCFVVIHLSGQRRLYGWPEEWPSSPERGHFLIAEAEWLVENGGRITLDDVETVLVPVAEVEMVEFMRKRFEERNSRDEQATFPASGQHHEIPRIHQTNTDTTRDSPDQATTATTAATKEVDTEHSLAPKRQQPEK